MPLPLSGAITVPVTNSLSRPGIRFESTRFVSGSGATGSATLAAWKRPGMRISLLAPVFSARR